MSEKWDSQDSGVGQGDLNISCTLICIQGSAILPCGVGIGCREADPENVKVNEQKELQMGF